MRWAELNIDVSRCRKKQDTTICPQCSKDRKKKNIKCLSVNLDTGKYYCHHCLWTGIATEFEKKEAIMQKAYIRPVWRNKTNLSDNLVKWFDDRGIRQDTLIRMKISEGVEIMPPDSVKLKTVQFNYFLNDVLINIKYRTRDKKFKLVSGAELILWNIDAIKGQKECVITEGEMDTLSYIQAGYEYAVSVPNGAKSKLDYLDNYIEDYLDDKETIYIASDNDSSGMILRDELIRRLGAEKCRIVTYGEDCKDANDHLVKYGAYSLLQTLKNAKEIKVDGVFQISDFEDSLDMLFESGLQKGQTIGHDNFDRLCSFETRRILIATGIPGSGKSEFVDEIAERLNMRYGWKFAYFSPENMPLQIHASKLISKITGMSFHKNYLSVRDYKHVKEYMEDNFFFICPEEDFSLDTILIKAKYLVKRRGIKALVLDPWNKIDHQFPPGMNETNYISKQLDKIITFSQRNDIFTIIIAHPVKKGKDSTGKTEVPTLYDISGSANFFNKADFGITSHRKDDDIVEIHVQKVKFKHLGETGIAVFKYNYTNGRYVPYTEGQETKLDFTNHLHAQKKEQNEDIFQEYEDASFFDPPPTDQPLPF